MMSSVEANSADAIKDEPLRQVLSEA